MRLYTPAERLAGLPAIDARNARLAASDYAALQLAMRRAKYFPCITPGPAFNGTTTDRPHRCNNPNAGRDVTYV